MKNVLKSLGKVILYFLLYYVLQLLVGFIFAIVITTQLIAENGGNIDSAAMTAQITKATQDSTAFLLVISALLTFLTFLIFFKARKKDFPVEIGLKPVGMKSLLWPALLGISFYLFISLLMGVLPIPDSMMDQYSEAYGALYGGNIVETCVAVLIFAPVLEEIVFRGIILSRLRRSMPAVVAAVISSVLFAVAHGNIVWMAYTFVLGLLLSFVCIKYRSILASIAVHFVFNLVGFIMDYINPQDLPDALSIGLLAVGFAASVVLIIVIGRHKTQVSATEPLVIMADTAEQTGGAGK